MDTDWFNRSELIGYKSASALKTYLNQRRSRFPSDRLHVLPLSLGGAIASEALSLVAPFDTLLLSQVSMAASCYDVNATTNPDLVALESGTSAVTPEWQPAGYRGAHTNLTRRIVNYFNTNDSFMALWLYNQKLFKPGAAYFYSSTNGGWRGTSGSSSYLVTDSQESRAMVSRSRTVAIGAQGPAVGQTNQGVIGSAVDLKAQFGIGSSADEHSAFFTRPIQNIWPYYDQVLEDCLIPRIRRQ
jgi:hypothetical protein